MRTATLIAMFVAQQLAAATAATAAEPSASPAAVAMPAAVELCGNCHRQDPSRLASADAQLIPLLGGQRARYLENALRAYAGRQRDHFFMRGMAAGLIGDDAQLKQALAYYSRRGPVKAKALEVPAAAQRCIGCHGSSDEAASTDVPILAGQHAAYLQRAFSAYAEGRRLHPVMQAQAADADGKPTVSATELETITRWFSQQRGVFSR